MSVDTAVYTAISDILDTALPVPVYDPVPDGAAMPYVVLAGQKTQTSDTSTTRVDLVTVSVEVWSDASGMTEALGLVAQIHEALHFTRPTLSAGVAVLVAVPSRDVARDTESGAFKGTVTIEIITEPT